MSGSALVPSGTERSDEAPEPGEARGRLSPKVAAERDGPSGADKVPPLDGSGWDAAIAEGSIDVAETDDTDETGREPSAVVHASARRAPRGAEAIVRIGRGREVEETEAERLMTALPVVGACWTQWNLRSDTWCEYSSFYSFIWWRCCR